jgi:uncharacterized LabA/DUF88 family protein
MRSQCCLYVDAGYLLASAATRLTGTSLRSGVRVHYEQLIKALTVQAEEVAGVPLLRINWYDAAKNALPDRDQEQIGSLQQVKLRLGRVGVDGEQKGVDLRIGLDMVAQSRNGAVDVVLLVSGDDDLTEAVEEAQVHGVQVKILGIPDQAGRPHGVSKHLLRAADGIELISAEALDRTVLRAVVAAEERPAPLPGPKPGMPIASGAPTEAGNVPVAAPGSGLPFPVPKPGPLPVYPPLVSAHPEPESTLAYQTETGGRSMIAPEYRVDDSTLHEAIASVVKGVVDSFLASATESEKTEMAKAKPDIPREVDRALLLDLAHRMDDYDLSDSIRKVLRAQFWEALEQALNGTVR